MARVLVAGATGYLGPFVSRELKARDHFVRALARAPEKLADLRDELDEIVTGEVKLKPRYLVGPGPKKAARLSRMPVRLREWLIGKFLTSGVERDAGEALEADRTDRGIAEQSGEQGVS